MLTDFQPLDAAECAPLGNLLGYVCDDPGAPREMRFAAADALAVTLAVGTALQAERLSKLRQFGTLLIEAALETSDMTQAEQWAMAFRLLWSVPLRRRRLIVRGDGFTLHLQGAQTFVREYFGSDGR